MNRHSTGRVRTAYVCRLAEFCVFTQARRVWLYDRGRGEKKIALWLSEETHSDIIFAELRVSKECFHQLRDFLELQNFRCGMSADLQLAIYLAWVGHGLVVTKLSQDFQVSKDSVNTAKCVFALHWICCVLPTLC